MTLEARAEKLYDDCHAFLRDRAVPIMLDALKDALEAERQELITRAEVFSDENGYDSATTRAIISFVQSRTHK